MCARIFPNLTGGDYWEWSHADRICTRVTATDRKRETGTNGEKKCCVPLAKRDAPVDSGRSGPLWEQQAAWETKEAVSHKTMLELSNKLWPLGGECFGTQDDPITSNVEFSICG